MKGIDMISIERIKKAAKKKRFLSNVFTKGEIKYAFSRKNPFKHLAGRFAAKEAFLKAIGAPRGIRWKDMEVEREDNRPEIKAHFGAKRLLRGKKSFLSLSYTDKVSMAMVLIESK